MTCPQLVFGFIGVLAFVGPSVSLSLPVDQNQNRKTANAKQNDKPVLGRQDVGDVGEGAELAQIGTQVGQIVTGVFSGNVGDIFKGTLPFIGDDDVQTGVGSIFETLTVPLNNLWASGSKQGLKYFGITEPTTVNPLLQQLQNQVQIINVNGTLVAVPINGTTGVAQAQQAHQPVETVTATPTEVVTEATESGPDEY